MLFRQEAVNHQNQSNTFGRVILHSHRLVFYLVTAIAIFAFFLLIFIFNASYTRRAPASGTLKPEFGLARVIMFQTGIVVKIHAHEGQSVRRGQALFTISSERVTNLGETTAESMSMLLQRKDRYKEELSNLQAAKNEQLLNLRKKVHDIDVQQLQLKQEISIQSSRIELAKKQLSRYQELARSGFSPQQQVQEKNDLYLDHQSKLFTLHRIASDLLNQRNSIYAEIQAIPRKHETERNNIEQLLLSLQQELGETAARREQDIVAPVDGMVTVIQSTVGQSVTAGQTLAVIVPNNSKLQVWFYVPSSTIGFVHPGQRVKLRYAAFPYQKFGQYDGTVLEVSRSAEPLNSREEINSQPVPPLYRIIVKPDSQNILAYGKAESLKADMQVEADILLDHRKIIEWIFEPFFAVKGKL
ncbi:HlyD family secretion protein [Pseudogulbenkiania ferrooxidans]|uniref:HlyD family secretion protein n=1 Tax=Pseudogulbenkiania ferrooxidans TaxID=549169 RepID=UPI0004277090|nr:HlyD family efflux transporter periplasmic adaptor subunit [Pseudogulbenkiania ferrooxidans]